MERCPSPDTLRLLLTEQLSEEEAGTVSGHVNTCSNCQEILDTLSDPSTGGLTVPRIAGYEVQKELGRGGMGIVYRAYDRLRGQPVALKVMQWLDPTALYRFKQEFRGLAGLHHPNLVTLYELATDGEQWFFTMELIEGVDFLRHVRTGPGELGRLGAALRQLAEGVAALHGAGMLHRDIKPSNVLVTPQGRVVLLDFGLAAELDRAGEHLSVRPQLLGTIPYMAPEQAASRPVSAASDWYAFGVILYEALTDRLPFVGPSLDVLNRKQWEDPPHPRELAPQAPAELAGLCWELLRRDPEARPRGEEVLRCLSPAAAPPPRGKLEVPLIGRARHLEALESAFEAARQGRTMVLALPGGSGVGKSALLRSFLDGLAERGRAVVLAGRCCEQESVPYKALDGLIDSLSRYLEGLPAAQVEALLPRDLQALVRVFPVLRRADAVALAPRRSVEAIDLQELRRRALAALRELLARLGDRRPLVLAIDDLQWGDLDSAALLSSLLQPPDPPVLLLLGCYRGEEVDNSPCLQAFLELLQIGGPVEGRQLPVEPLGPEERLELARALLPSDHPGAMGQAERIARQSGGYPFFVHELVQHLQAGLPLDEGEKTEQAKEVTLQEVLWSRVLHLPPDARELLEVVALAGRPVGQEAAWRAAGLQGKERQAVALLRSARLLRGAGPAERHEIETYHDRVRETVVAHLTPDVRRRHHRSLASVLEQAGGGDPEVLAAHFEAAGEAERAGHYCVQAGGQAAEALAFGRAAELYRLALQLQTPSAEQARPLRIRLADALAADGRGVEAAIEYLAAAGGAAGAEALDLQRRAALQHLRSGHVDAGLAVLRMVLAAVGLRMPSTPRRAFWSLVWLRLRLRLRGLKFHYREDAPAEVLTVLDVCQTAAVGLTMVDFIQGAYFQSRALLLALQAGEPVRLATALAMEGGLEGIGGSWNQRRTGKLLQTAEELARKTGRPYPLAMTALTRGVASALAGDWPAGQALCDQSEAAFRETCTGVMWELGTAHRFALWPMIFMGELAEVSRRLPRLIEEARERDDLYEVTNLSLVVRTFLFLASDEPGRARAELEQVMDRWSQQGFHVQHMNRLYDEAQIDLYEGLGLSAWKRLTAHWTLLKRSHLLRVQQVRIFLVQTRARAALSAISEAADPEPFLRAAGRDASALWRERVAWARALAQLIRAGLATARADTRNAAVLLREAAGLCDGAAMRLYAAAARRRLGKLLGGAEGEELVAQADSWMAGQNVVSPERMTAMLVPGFPESSVTKATTGEPPGSSQWH